MNKNYIKISLMAIALGSMSAGLTSCNDLLDMPSYTADDTSNIFDTEDKADLFVKGCYRGLIHEEFYRQYNSGETITMATEEALSGSKYMIANYHYDPLMPATLTTAYSESYRIIESCNTGIEGIGKMPESKRRNALLAELYTLRAYAYYNLIRFYGDVPAIFQSLASMDPEAESTFYPKRASRDLIYDRIVGDMQQWVDCLPWYSESGYAAPERLSKQAALGILARICLNAGGYSLRWDLATESPSSLKMARRDDASRVREFYQIADDALARVIARGENSLIQASGDMSGFQYLFYNYCQRNFGTTAPEMMWHLAQYGSTTNSSFGVYNAQPGSTGGAYGQRKTLQGKLPTYYLSFDAQDTRRDVSCTDYSVTYVSSNATDQPWANIGTGYSSILGGKFRIQWCVEPAEAAKRNVDIPMLRYSDILLMYAETQNYLNNGPTAAAKSALSQVRTRAGIGSMTIPASQDAFQDALLQERKWEFADEFLVRNDLIRMNLLDRELKQCKQDMLDLSDHTGKYAGVATYRLYKFVNNAQTYGDTFLTLPYIDVTDPTEVALIATKPSTSNSAMTAFNNKIQTILKNHGITDGSVWYATNMFENWNSSYNQNCRLCAGFKKAATTTLSIGASTYTLCTGRSENGGTYPAWIDGETGLFYGYVANKTELFPFANVSAGHPMVDNPNLTQHPGYAQ